MKGKQILQLCFLQKILGLTQTFLNQEQHASSFSFKKQINVEFGMNLEE